MWIWQYLPLVGIFSILNGVDAGAVITKDMIIVARNQELDHNQVKFYDYLGHPLKCVCQHVHSEDAKKHKLHVSQTHGSNGPVHFPGGESTSTSQYTRPGTPELDIHNGPGSHSGAYDGSLKTDGFSTSSSSSSSHTGRYPASTIDESHSSHPYGHDPYDLPVGGTIGSGSYSVSHSSDNKGTPGWPDIHSDSRSGSYGPGYSASSSSTANKIGRYPDGYKTEESHSQYSPYGPNHHDLPGGNHEHHDSPIGTKGSGGYSESHSSSSINGGPGSGAWSVSSGPSGYSTSSSTANLHGPGKYTVTERNPAEPHSHSTYTSHEGPKRSGGYTSVSHSSASNSDLLGKPDSISGSWSVAEGPKGSSASSISSSSQHGLGPDGKYKVPRGEEGSNGYSVSSSSTKTRGIPDGAVGDREVGGPGRYESHSSTDRPYGLPEGHGKIGITESHSSISTPGRHDGKKWQGDGYQVSHTPISSHGRPDEYGDVHKNYGVDAKGNGGYETTHSQTSTGPNGGPHGHYDIDDSFVPNTNNGYTHEPIGQGGHTKSHTTHYSGPYGSPHSGPGGTGFSSGSYGGSQNGPFDSPHYGPGGSFKYGIGSKGPQSGPGSSSPFGPGGSLQYGVGGIVPQNVPGGSSQFGPSGNAQYDFEGIGPQTGGSSQFGPGSSSPYGPGGSHSSWSESYGPNGYKGQGDAGFPYGPQGPINTNPLITGNQGGVVSSGNIGLPGNIGGHHKLPIGCFAGHIVVSDKGKMKWIIDALDTPTLNSFQERTQNNYGHHQTLPRTVLRSNLDYCRATGIRPQTPNALVPWFARYPCRRFYDPCNNCDRNCFLW